MKNLKIESRDDIVRFIVERPAWMYFHTNMGLKKEITENASDMLDGIKDFGKAVIYLAGCLGLALVQVIMILTYPFSKAISLLKVRKHVMKEYRRMINRDQAKG